MLISDVCEINIKVIHNVKKKKCLEKLFIGRLMFAGQGYMWAQEIFEASIKQNRTFEEVLWAI